MRILIAPDKFKGTLTGSGAALAMTHGVRNVRPEAWVSATPLADGGAGTLEVLLDAVGGVKRFADTVDPWGAKRRAPIALLNSNVACIETAASSSGDPLRADSEGIGTLIKAAAEMCGAGGTVLVGVGGTMSTDGGVGLARALGWGFFDEGGRPLPAGGGSLAELRYIDRPSEPLDVTVIGLCDVDIPLEMSAEMFGPQKGASPDQVELLTRGLVNLADIVRGTLDIDLSSLPFGGAGGGIGAGLVAFVGAELRSGFSYIADAVHLADLIGMADAVITGEGRFDEQSLRGKVPAGVAAMAHEHGVPCLGLFGHLSVSERMALNAGFSDVLDLRGVEMDGKPADPGELLTSATEALVRRQPF
ncbi:MAG: glycerate kinase [Actinomycetota bacterium]